MAAAPLLLLVVRDLVGIAPESVPDEVDHDGKDRDEVYERPEPLGEQRYVHVAQPDDERAHAAQPGQPRAVSREDGAVKAVTAGEPVGHECEHKAHDENKHEE